MANRRQEILHVNTESGRLKAGAHCRRVESTPDGSQMNAANTANACRPDVILVIEDTSEVLDSIQGLLESGDCVLHATSSTFESVKSYETPWRGIKLVLSNSLAQTLRDDEVVEYLQRMNPTVRAVFVSSGNGDAAKKTLVGRLRGLLEKPL